MKKQHRNASWSCPRLSRRAPLLGRLWAFGVALGVAFSVLGSFGLLGCSSGGEGEEEISTTSIISEFPPAMTAPNGSWVRISGRVVSSSAESFLLDYGSGHITIEMDDWDAFPEGYQMLTDDEVIVYGYVDHDFFERRSIEASSVYVRGLGTQFFANGVDDESLPGPGEIAAEAQIELTGTVSEVSPEEGFFTINTRGGGIEVSTEELGFDPFDEEGTPRIGEGDRVRVTAPLEDGLFVEGQLRVHTLTRMR